MMSLGINANHMSCNRSIDTVLHTIDMIYQGNAASVEYMDTANRIYSLISQQRCSEKLYEETTIKLSKHIAKIARAVCNACESEKYQNTLRIVMDYWYNFDTNNRTVEQLFIHLEKYYKTNKKPSIGTLGMELFCSQVLKNEKISMHLNDTVAKLIRLDRLNDLKSDHTKFSTTSSMGDDDHGKGITTTERDLIKSYIDMLETLSRKGLRVYLGEFVMAVISRSRIHFQQHSQALRQSLDPIDYLGQVQCIILEERYRAEIYSLNTLGARLEELVETYYVSAYARKLISEGNSSLYALMMRNDLPALSLFYSIFSRTKEFFECFISEYSSIITRHLEECQNNTTPLQLPPKGPAHQLPPLDINVVNLDRVILFIMLAERQVTQVFHSSEQLQFRLKQDVLQFFKRLPNCMSILGAYFNELILLHPDNAKSRLLASPTHAALAAKCLNFSSLYDAAFSASPTPQEQVDVLSNSMLPGNADAAMSDNVTQAPFRGNSRLNTKPFMDDSVLATPPMTFSAQRAFAFTLWESRCRIVAGICSLQVADGDALCELYRAMASERLLKNNRRLNDTVLRLEYETRNLISAGAGFGKSFVERTTKMFNDTIVSSRLIEKYKGLQALRATEFKDTDIPSSENNQSSSYSFTQNSQVPYWWTTRSVVFKPTVITSNLWVTAPPVEVKYSPEANYLMQSYLEMFTKTNSDCKMDWNPSYGSATLEVQISSGTHTLIMTTYQMIIFMLFVNRDTYTLAEILELTGIPDTEIGRQILPFAHPHVQLFLKNPNTRELSETDTYTFNTNARLPTQVFRVPLLNMASINKIGKRTDQSNVAREFTAEEKKFAVNAAVMSVAKKRQKVAHDILQKEVQLALEGKFEVDIAIFKRSVEYLLENEYIERDSEDRNMFVYM